MKKIISVLLIAALTLSVATPVLSAESPYPSKEKQRTDEVFSLCVSDGEIMTVILNRKLPEITSKVYINGTLMQQSIANSNEKTVMTVIYDLAAERGEGAKAEQGILNGFTTYTTHAPASTERILTSNLQNQSRSIDDEPVDNEGLSPSGYGDGYYYLGSQSGPYYAPNVYGYLYRSYTEDYVGETKYYSWGAGESASAIAAILGAILSPVEALFEVLTFAADATLSYAQSLELATYNLVYNYRVRVNGGIHYTTYRDIDYWRIDNTTTGKSQWIEKSFNDGFSMGNSEMILIGIENYLLSTQ